MQPLKCLRCGAEIEFVKREKIQHGKTGWIIGDCYEMDTPRCPCCGANNEKW